MAVADKLEEARAALQMINPAPFNAEAPPEALAGDITPTELHYVRSNFAVPTHDGTLEVRVEGADHGSYHLRPVLPETNQQDLTFVRSLPIALATDPAAELLVAYEMNGEPLGPDHGAPFRLIVPHWYAVASVKWLKRIDVLTEPYSGEFQTGHYMYEWPDRPHEAVTLMRVRARITDPAPGSAVGRGTHAVRGKAWSGTGPVTSVDVSLTGEGDWHPARLEPPQGPYHWQDWSFDWAADDIGRH